MNRFSRKRGTYSSEHCSGFSPDSLLIPPDDSARKTNNGTKILFFLFIIFIFAKIPIIKSENNISCLFGMLIKIRNLKN